MALVVKNPPANAGDVRDAGSIPESRKSPGGGHGNPLQYSCLENPMVREAWQATVHGGCREADRLKQLSIHAQNTKYLLVPPSLLSMFKLTHLVLTIFF